MAGCNIPKPAMPMPKAPPRKDAIPIEFIQERIESLRKLIERYRGCHLAEDAAVYYAGEVFVLEELIRIWKEDGRK